MQVHLLVDTTLQGQKFTVQAYTSRQLSIKDKPLATEFVEVPSEVLYTDIERVGGEHRASVVVPEHELGLCHVLSHIMSLLT